ncbi:MAG TPA: signal peptide peptidase SppA [Candidatus Phocaeicola gallinarum]|uniref:signal peptide peptidase SppA n=1 Tax=Bacteroides caecicola TaxID=1462569 RepID=UPI001C5C68EF|nr:signal peptide peptidase SppA [Bacteroides caecicola]MCL1626184.1 signal peptide peptidase SppA [Bacteroides caecicola]HJC96909.1 signal peptide peptidase SppA [Candidatus Phocaeicola gallinarum]
MKEFLRSMLATIAGIIVVGFIFFILSLFTITGFIAMSESETTVRENSIFLLDLTGNVSERYQQNPLDQILGEKQTTYGLDDILSSIKKAKENENIKGIYLNAGAYNCSTASLQAIRNALVDFKESGKFIVAYSGMYTQSAYYIASVADKIIVNPSGNIMWHGLSAQTMFFTDLLKKVGIEMQIFRVGTYKSAVEPFTETAMSQANREQTQAFVSSLWEQFVTDVSASRNLTPERLNELADLNMDFQPAETYIENGLADTLMYKDGVLTYLKKLTDCKEDQELSVLTLNDMTNVKRNTPKDKSGNIIAVYYAYGEIDSQADIAYDEGINSEKVIKDLRKLRENKDVKAVVLRVNSPGGSAYASEQIWREVSLLKEEKPVIVSMGDYAASGGYYISCAATQIVAEPTTLTGSIGIFGMFPDVSKLVNDKLDIHIDGVKTNQLSDIGIINRPFNPEEQALIQNMVNEGYELFTKRCADGRNIPIEELKKIAEGRVWTGAMAKELNLVDELGGLDKAIAIAADTANVENYTILSYPAKEDIFTSLLNINGERYIKSKVKNLLGNYGNAFMWMNHAAEADRLQARMPFEYQIK